MELSCQAALEEEIDGALSVCRQSLETLPPIATAQALWAQITANAAASLENLLRGIDAASGRIPQVRGFFTGASERRLTYGAACSFAELFQRELARLDVESLGFSELYELLRGRELRLLQIEAEARELQKNARWQGMENEAQEADELCRLLAAQRENDAVLLRSAKELEGALGDFYLHTCSEFCRLMAAKADFAHEGNGASPGEVSRLLWGLRQALETLLQAI